MVMILLAIFLMMLILGPSLSRSIEASNNGESQLKTQPLEPGPVTSKSGQPGFSVEGDTEGEKTSDVYDEIKSPNVGFQLKYEKYLQTFIYFVVEKEKINIWSGPSIEEDVLRVANKNEKLSYYETVEKDDTWYHVTWEEDDEKQFGFVHHQDVSKRVFQFDKMLEMIGHGEQEFKKGNLTYINNYKNLQGYAPKYYGNTKDKEGNKRSQSAPGYENLSNLAEFTYLEDGSLVRVISQDSQYTKVSLLRNGKEYYVPNKYIPGLKAVTGINKVIAIDRKNQNEVIFERIDGEWKVISYTLATTGKEGPYHVPTPLGYFYGIEKRDQFYYYKDGTNTIQGYAPYVIRFTGGAYVHGVGVDYKYEGGKRIDPGKVEYSSTIGTKPLSHKCVRNYTSHAKFLHEWFTQGETIFIVME